MIEVASGKVVVGGAGVANGSILSLASPDEKTLLVAGHDGVVRTWTPGERVVHTGDRFNLPARAVSLPGGERVLEACGTVLGSSDLAGQRAGSPHAHAMEITAVVPIGASLAASISMDATIALWDTSAALPREVDRISVDPTGDTLMALTATPDGEGFAVGTSRGVILQFELK